MNILEFLRTHPRLASHVPEILCIWRANCETSLISSTDAVIKYILKVRLALAGLTLDPPLYFSVHYETGDSLTLI